MTVFFTHVDWTPAVYGVVMFLGLWLVYWKLTTGRWLSVFIDVTVWTIVFVLHGGTMSGGFAAMLAAMLAGIVFPYLIRR